MKDRSVIILGCNEKKYMDFSLHCADSVKLHNPGLPVFIVTNLKFEDNVPGVKFIPISDEWAKLYIETKIYIDRFIQTEESLFIDSDCLCYGNLDPIFEACQGADVTVVGRSVPLVDFWSHEKEFAEKTFGIDRAIIFNGAFYYLKKSAVTTRIYERARELSGRYDEYRFRRIQNNWKNDEIVLAISMAANGQYPIDDDGKFVTDLYTDRRPNKLNVLRGKRLLRNPAYPLTEPREWYPPTFSPIVIHYGGNNIKNYPYISQSVLLTLRKIGFPDFLSGLIVYTFIDIPYKSYHWIRKIVGLK